MEQVKRLPTDYSLSSINLLAHYNNLLPSVSLWHAHLQMHDMSIHCNLFSF